MSVLRDPNSARIFTWGVRIDRAAAILPQTATTTLYTVTGQVLVTGLFGTVTLATGATATNLKITSIPTVGTAVDLCANGLVTSKEVGAHFTLPAALASALTVSNAGAVSTAPALGIVVPSGVISWTTDASNTGQARWQLTYIPLDDGATVA